jgi:hypothetical protein
MDSEEKDVIELLPFDLPMTLLSLEISHMSELQILPSLCLGSLRSIAPTFCDSLRTLPPLPISLLNLVITSCNQIESLNLPNDLEELSCESCDNLELNLSNLPMQLQKLRIRNCDQMGRATQLDQLPVHLKDLELEGFDNLVSLPPLPSGLNSLCLQRCHSPTLLPILPESLRKLALYHLPYLKRVASLPDNLEELSLSKCEKLKKIDHIPHKLRSLKIDKMDSLQLLNFCLPQILEHWKSQTVQISNQVLRNICSKWDLTQVLRELILQEFKYLKMLPILSISLEKF